MDKNSIPESVPVARVIRFSLFSVILLPTAHVVVDIFSSVLLIALPLFKASWGLTFTQIGLVVTILNITSSVSQPILGTISDRWQTHWFIPVGLVWMGTMISLLGVTPNYPLLLMLVFLAGFGSAAFHPRGLKAMAEASGARRGLANATFMLGGNIGFALGPVVGSLLFLNLGLKGSLFLLVPTVLFGLPLWQIRANYAQPAVQVPRPIARSGRSNGVLSGLVIVCIIVVVRSWVHSATMTFFPLFMQARGYELGHAGTLLFIFLISGAFGGLLGGYLSDLWGRKRVIFTGLAAFTPAMLLFLRSPDSTAGLLFLVLAGIAIFAPFSVTLTLAQELLPGRTGLTSGLTLGLGFGVGGMGVSISGIISDLYGLTANMYFLALLPLAAIPLLSVIREQR